MEKSVEPRNQVYRGVSHVINEALQISGEEVDYPVKSAGPAGWPVGRKQS